MIATRLEAMMRSFFLAAAARVLIPAAALAQPVWQHTYGSSDPDAAKSVQQTSDGGYVLAGGTYSFGAGSCDFWLIKTDSLGDTTWTRTCGGTGNDLANSVCLTADGGYAIAGYTESSGDEDGDVMLVKTDSQGRALWTRSYGGAGWDDCYSVRQTVDLGYILVGLTENYGAGYTDVWLVKTDSLGDTLWTRTFGGTSFDEGHDVLPTSDGGHLIAAATASFSAGAMDGWLIKTDSAGDTLWTRVYGGADDDRFYSAAMTTGRGYVITGSTASSGAGGPDFWLLRVNGGGDTLWTHAYGGTGTDEAWSGRQTSDGGYFIAGCTESFGAGASDVWLVRTDASGDTLWTCTYGDTGSDEAYSALPTADVGYIIAGTTTSIGAGSYDAWLIKVGPEGPVAVAEPRPPVTSKPACSVLTIGKVLCLPEAPLGTRYSLLSADGRRVCRLNAGNNDIRALAPGVYYVAAGVDGSVLQGDVRKVIVTR